MENLLKKLFFFTIYLDLPLSFVVPENSGINKDLKLPSPLEKERIKDLWLENPKVYWGIETDIQTKTKVYYGSLKDFHKAYKENRGDFFHFSFDKKEVLKKIELWTKKEELEGFLSTIESFHYQASLSNFYDLRRSDFETIEEWEEYEIKCTSSYYEYIRDLETKILSLKIELREVDEYFFPSLKN